MLHLPFEASAPLVLYRVPGHQQGRLRGHGQQLENCAAMRGLTETNSLVGSVPMQKYYAQIDWSTPQPQNSRTIGAFMAISWR